MKCPALPETPYFIGLDIEDDPVSWGITKRLTRGVYKDAHRILPASKEAVSRLNSKEELYFQIIANKIYSSVEVDQWVEACGS